MDFNDYECDFRLQSELDDTREELLETMNELNQTMNDSIHEFEDGKGSTGSNRASATKEIVEQVEHQELRCSQLECEVSQLQEKLAQEALKWQEKEQQYVSEINTLRSVDRNTPPVNTVDSNNVVPATSTASNNSAGFFVKSSIAIISALYVFVHSRI